MRCKRTDPGAVLLVVESNRIRKRRKPAGHSKFRCGWRVLLTRNNGVQVLSAPRGFHLAQASCEHAYRRSHARMNSFKLADGCCRQLTPLRCRTPRYRRILVAKAPTRRRGSIDDAQRRSTVLRHVQIAEVQPR